MLLIALLPLPALADYPSYALVSEGIIPTNGLNAQLPAATLAPNGGILVQFNLATDQFPESKAYLVRSTNAGFSWTSPVLMLSTQSLTAPLESVATNVGLTTLSNGSIIAPHSIGALNSAIPPSGVYPGMDYSYPYVSISSDNGNSWGGRIPAGSAMHSAFGKVIERQSDGALLMTMWNHDQWNDPAAFARHSGYAVSYDFGRSWPEFHPIADYGETAIIQLDDQSYLAIIKRHGLMPPSRIYSSPDGITWSDSFSSFGGGKNASLHKSPHGYVMALYSVSGGKGRSAYTVDAGRKWFTAFELEDGAYGITAANLGSGQMIVTYGLNYVLHYKIFREDQRFGFPEGYALGEEPAGNVVTTAVNVDRDPYAYPCPWRSDRHAGSPIRFSRLPANYTIKLYTITAELVTTLTQPSWDLTNSRGERVASGVYLFLVTNNEGFKSSGKLVVIK